MVHDGRWPGALLKHICWRCALPKSSISLIWREFAGSRRPILGGCANHWQSG